MTDVTSATQEQTQQTQVKPEDTMSSFGVLRGTIVEVKMAVGFIEAILNQISERPIKDARMIYEPLVAEVHRVLQEKGLVEIPTPPPLS